jgi:hypothetical protein
MANQTLPSKGISIVVNSSLKSLPSQSQSSKSAIKQDPSKR